MLLKGQELSKKQPYTFTASLKETIVGTLATGNRVVTGIAAGNFDYLEQGKGWSVSGTGIPGGTTISEICREKREITLSNPSTAGGLTDITVTTGASWVGRSLRFRMSAVPSLTDPFITKTVGSGIVIDNATDATITISDTDADPLVLNLSKKVEVPETGKSYPVAYAICHWCLDFTDGDRRRLATGTVTFTEFQETPTIPEC